MIRRVLGVSSLASNDLSKTMTDNLPAPVADKPTKPKRISKRIKALVSGRCQDHHRRARRRG
ncbi:hypothetical protein [Bradyrhizobium sp. DASA03120]|uniref:hypothetical protein n=1 Tax=Bradyrhizobium sp. SMVTL-02 TaxID=3395917 RepID=UPI003F71BFF6